MIKKILFRTLGGLSVLLLLFVAFGAYYAVYELPSHLEAPLAVVKKIPPAALLQQKQTIKAYDGLHPSLSSRPADTFPYPIGLGGVGPTENLFAGPHKYPFWCGSNRITNQQPLVDNQDGYGVPVFRVGDDAVVTSEIVGYSKDCRHVSAVNYYYLSADDGSFHPLERKPVGDDVAKIMRDGVEREFIVRLESGTINRHFYALAVLKGDGETLQQASSTLWNKRLIYQFRGGVGIGRRQGNLKANDVLKRRKEQLSLGYAVIYSSANQTSNHYDMWLAEDTALRVKRQFVSQYGKPLYTVGVGGSGGAIQQFLIAQNNRELLDGIIPLYSYPDMISQTNYVLDCEPLEYFFDVQDGSNQRWDDWSERVRVEGLSSASEAFNRFSAMTTAATALQGRLTDISLDVDGSSECVQSWRGLTPLIHNPNFVHFASNYSTTVQSQTDWTHWEDLYWVYGRDEHGYAQSTWDNVGVQYGLQALTDGHIGMEEFLQINRSIGGWVSAQQMEAEKFWFLQGELFPVDLSVWSHQNLNLPSGGELPAKRTQASVEAIGGAYRSGHVFLGHLDIPVLDVRHYLDDQLDMHHSSASFMTRARMLRAQGHADNHIVWMSHQGFNPVDYAFEVMDEWLVKLLERPRLGVAASRPYSAADTCFNEHGEVIAMGQGVWDGQWNQRSVGACLAVYPNHKTSREIAGGPISGDVFKCHRQTLPEAISRGVYGDLEVWSDLEALEQVFPDGVCDYSMADVGRPNDLLAPVLLAEEPVPKVAPVTPVAAPSRPVVISRLEGIDAPAVGVQ